MAELRTAVGARPPSAANIGKIDNSTTSTTTNNITQINVVAALMESASSPPSGSASGSASASEWSGRPLLGWPKSWPSPPVSLLPCIPPSFEITRKQLLRGVEGLGGAEKEACRRGEPSAAAALYVGLLRQVHAGARAQWNVFLHPDRADMALVLKGPCTAAAGRGVWQIMPLEDAIRKLFAHIVRAIAALPPPLPPRVCAEVQAATKCFDERPGEVAKSARRTMACHLGNLRACLAAPEEETPSVDGPAGGGGPELFGLERLDCFKPKDVLLDLLVWVEAGRATSVAAASQAAKHLARVLVARHPRNMTAVLLTEARVGRQKPLEDAQAARQTGLPPMAAGQRALVHRPQGWVEEDAVGAAQALAAKVGGLLAHIIRARPGLSQEEAAPLDPLADHLEAQLTQSPREQHRGAGEDGAKGAARGGGLLSAEEWSLELLGWYSRQAEELCADEPAFAGLRAALEAKKQEAAAPFA